MTSKTTVTPPQAVEANARLMAAAPDLLRMVRDAHAEAHGDCTEEGCSDWCREFQKVIDKAEGRS